MTRVVGLEFPLARDPNEIIQIQIFIKGIRNQPCLRLIRFSKVKVVITLIHMGRGVPHRLIRLAELIKSSELCPGRFIRFQIST